jgi:hypothetical protein
MMNQNDPDPRLPMTKCHSQKMCDALIRQGWVLHAEFRANPADEPYEYVLVWERPRNPPESPRIDGDESD